ncbi:MAG: iron ABC transporter permease [Oscillospiraceae bacterium]|nr:iron ABC transporter permease [Oscillospiraceae bacterium]
MARRPDYQKEIDDRELNSQIQLHIETESRNLFKNEVTRRHAMSAGGRNIALLCIVLLLVFIASVILVPTGNLNLPSWRSEVITNVSNLFSLTIASRWRLCAFAAMVLVGMAMATCGAVFQGVFQNPMASPTTLGVQAGGTLGGLVYIFFFLDAATLSFYSEHLTSTGGDIIGTGNYTFSATADEILAYYESLTQYQEFALQIWEVLGCFFGVVLIVGISLIAGRGKISTVALMLSGSIFSTVINQLGQTVQYIILYNTPEDVSDARYYLISALLGGRSTIDSNIMPVDEFLWMAIPILIALAVLFSLTGKLNILMFGEEEAKVMGLPVQTYRIIFIVFCTLLSAVVLSFVGQVSMLGFLIPHLARFMVGPDFKTLVPASALLGGITTLLVWDFCCMVNNLSGFNMYTGVVCTALSLIFILFYRRNRHADWS